VPAVFAQEVVVSDAVMAVFKMGCPWRRRGLAAGMMRRQGGGMATWRFDVTTRWFGVARLRLGGTM
jgi:hypothetical protein